MLRLLCNVYIFKFEFDFFKQYEENQKLKRQLESQEETIFNQRGLIDAMTEAQEELSANLKEQLQVLQQQSITYSEDFENERLDREKVQSRVSDLEGELEATRTLVRFESNHVYNPAMSTFQISKTVISCLWVACDFHLHGLLHKS